MDRDEEIAGPADVISVDYTTLSELGNRFRDLAAAFGNATDPLGRSYDDATMGAEQFAALLAPGATKFLLSWREAFEVCRDSSTVIGSSIGQTEVDFRSVDLAHSTVTL